MEGWLGCASVRRSSAKRARREEEGDASGWNLIATRFPRSSRSARKTTPIPSSPGTFPRRYGPILRSGDGGDVFIEERRALCVCLEHSEDFGGEFAVVATSGAQERSLCGGWQIGGRVEQRLNST